MESLLHPRNLVVKVMGGKEVKAKGPPRSSTRSFTDDLAPGLSTKDRAHWDRGLDPGPERSITSARDPPMLKPSQKPGTVLTVMQDTVIVPMLDMLHTAMDIVMLLHTPGDTESKLVKKK